MNFGTLDLLDRQLVHALDIDGRAPFSRIAAVLGTSDRTIARRYRRLRSTGRFQVVGLAEPTRVGHVQWFVRIRCTPDAATSVATALARRDDTAWVSLNSGGTEIICTVRTRSDEERDSLLLQKLPRTPRVISVSAHYVLHQFVRGPRGWGARLGALTEHQADELLATEPGAAGDTGRGGDRARIELADGDEAMLAVLARDGRAGYAELAAASGWSESMARRRMDFLRQAGALFFDIDIDARLLGFRTEAMLWLTVAPSELAAVGEALASHIEIPFAAATTGPTNVVATVICPDTPALYRYLTERIGALDAVRQAETAPRIRHLKRAGTPDPRWASGSRAAS